MILLAIAVRYNESSKALFKLYPLIAFLSLAIIFIAVYFFRAITVSREEIRYHGLFSSKDSALITKNKTLSLTLIGAKRISVELLGDAGETPAFEWMRQDDVVHREICLFRGKAIGGVGTVSKILVLFGMPEDADFKSDGFRFEDDNVEIFAENSDLGRTMKIHFKTTIL